MILPQHLARERWTRALQAETRSRKRQQVLWATVLSGVIWMMPAAQAQPQVQPQSQPQTQPQTQTPAPAQTPAAEAAPAAVESGDVPLTQERFYEILLADVALQRREPVLATRTYLKLAQEIQSPWFAQRAAESALTANDQTLFQQALELWQKLDPTSDQPQRLKIQVAHAWQNTAGQSADEVRAQLEALLKEAAANDSLGETFLRLNAAFARQPDKIANFNIIRAVALPYQQQPEAHYAVALAALVATTSKAPEREGVLAKILHVGLQEINLALDGEPQWDDAVQLKVALLEKVAPEQLLPWLQSSVEKTPGQKNLWPLLARALVQKKQYAEAREWFLKIWHDSGDDSALVAAGALSMQMNDRTAAQELLAEVKEKNGNDKANALRIAYARIAEDERRPLEAIEWYRQVNSGDDWWDVQLHLAALLAQNGKRDEALTLLTELPAVTLEERINVLQMRARILREAGDWEAAFKLLKNGVELFPESTDLLLDLGLVEEKRGHLKNAEKYLRTALKLKPNEPYVQNALGYTLVDHRLSVDEGAALIEKALRSLPDDGAILDSMGWARYRQGKSEEALRYLQQAWDKFPDAEVAAHWGEVLWQQGRLEEARQIWAQGLKQTPRDTLIRETMKRLNAGEPEAAAPAAGPAGATATTP